MKYKTLFRVLLKLIGVWFVATGVTELFVYLGWQFFSEFNYNPGTNWVARYWSLLTPLSKLAIGSYLFFGGRWIADFAIPGNRPYCHECGYDLTGAAGERCNECGTPFKAEGATRA